MKRRGSPGGPMRYWSEAETDSAFAMMEDEVPAAQIAKLLGRTVCSVEIKMREERYKRFYGERSRCEASQPVPCDNGKHLRMVLMAGGFPWKVAREKAA